MIDTTSTYIPTTNQTIRQVYQNLGKVFEMKLLMKNQILETQESKR